MIDREKVIKGLKIHADRSDKTDCDDCPYIKDGFSNGNCIGQLCSDALSLLKDLRDAIAMLKAHEAKEVEAEVIQVGRSVKCDG